MDLAGPAPQTYATKVGPLKKKPKHHHQGHEGRTKGKVKCPAWFKIRLKESKGHGRTRIPALHFRKVMACFGVADEPAERVR
jgi:hypothetical protein